MVTHEEMALAEMPLRSASPAANEVVVERAAQHRAQNRNQSRRPLFRCLGSRFDGDALDDARHQPLEYFLLEHLAAEIEARGAGGGEPELRHLVFGRILEAVNEAEPLNHADGDRRE